MSKHTLTLVHKVNISQVSESTPSISLSEAAATSLESTLPSLSPKPESATLTPAEQAEAGRFLTLTKNRASKRARVQHLITHLKAQKGPASDALEGDTQKSVRKVA